MLLPSKVQRELYAYTYERDVHVAFPDEPELASPFRSTDQVDQSRFRFVAVALGSLFEQGVQLKPLGR